MQQKALHHYLLVLNLFICVCFFHREKVKKYDRTLSSSWSRVSAAVGGAFNSDLRLQTAQENNPLCITMVTVINLSLNTNFIYQNKLTPCSEWSSSHLLHSDRQLETDSDVIHEAKCIEMSEHLAEIWSVWVGLPPDVVDWKSQSHSDRNAFWVHWDLH